MIFYPSINSTKFTKSLADEPTGNVDSETGDKIIQLLRDLSNSGITIVLVTHNRELAGRADRIVHIRDGRMVGQ